MISSPISSFLSLDVCILGMGIGGGYCGVEIVGVSFRGGYWRWEFWDGIRGVYFRVGYLRCV